MTESQTNSPCGASWMEGLEPQVPRVGWRKRMLEFGLRPFPQRFAWRIRYLSSQHRWPRLSPPRSFNEKVIWRITEDRRSVIGTACDKLASKRLMAAAYPAAVIPKVYWQGEDLRDLVGCDLPDRWVLKPNNGYGQIRFGEGNVSPSRARELIDQTEGWLDRPFQGPLGHRIEWGYTQADRCYFVEEFIGDGERPPTDYKLRVFDGEVEQISVIDDFFGNASITPMTPEWEPVPVARSLYPTSQLPPRKPISFDSMLECASAVGSLFDFIRVDLYDSPGGPVFGELTAYPSAGLMPTKPRSFDLALGAHWTLPTDAGPT